jgi:transposase
LRIVGIDTGITSKHCAVVVDSDTGKDSKPIAFSTDLAEIAGMVNKASSNGSIDLFAIETAGETWYALATYFHQQGFKVALISPEKSHDFRVSLRKHTKTNRIDAGAIARSVLIAPGNAQLFVPRTGNIEALRRLTRRYSSLQTDLTARKLAIRAELRSLLPTWRQPDNLFTIPYKQWLKQADPWYWNDNKEAELLEIIKDQTAVKSILDACRQSRKLFADCPQGSKPGVMALRQEIALLELFEEQLSALMDEITNLYQVIDAKGVLCSLCGIGIYTGAAILGEVYHIARFRNSSAFNAYCGVIPKRNDTGDTHREGQPMTKQGNHHLRRLLYLAALSAIQGDPELAALYYKQKIVLKKHHYKAMGFVMNAMARRIYAVLKRNCHLFGLETPQMEDRPYTVRLAGQPIDVKAARQWIKEKGLIVSKKKSGSHAGHYPPEAVITPHEFRNGSRLSKSNS